MGKEQASTQLKVEIARVLREILEEFVGQRLSSKLADETFVVDLASDLPRGDDHLILFFIGQAQTLPAGLAYKVMENVLNLMRTLDPPFSQ